MTINSPDAFCASLWDWACLDGCFGDTRIKPTDVDGLIERHGWFLLLETKLPGVTIPHGQELTIQALLDTGRFTAVYVWGKPQEPVKIELITARDRRTYDPACLDDLRSIVARWFAWADDHMTMTV